VKNFKSNDQLINDSMMYLHLHYFKHMKQYFAT